MTKINSLLSLFQTNDAVGSTWNELYFVPLIVIGSLRIPPFFFLILNVIFWLWHFNCDISIVIGPFSFFLLLMPWPILFLLHLALNWNVFQKQLGRINSFFFFCALNVGRIWGSHKAKSCNYFCCWRDIFRESNIFHFSGSFFMLNLVLGVLSG